MNKLFKAAVEFRRIRQQVHVEKGVRAVVYAGLVDLHRCFVTVVRGKGFYEHLKFLLIAESEAAESGGIDANRWRKELPFLCENDRGHLRVSIFYEGSHEVAPANNFNLVSYIIRN